MCATHKGNILSSTKDTLTLAIIADNVASKVKDQTKSRQAVKRSSSYIITADTNIRRMNKFTVHLEVSGQYTHRNTQSNNV